MADSRRGTWKPLGLYQPWSECCRDTERAGTRRSCPWSGARTNRTQGQNSVTPEQGTLLWIWPGMKEKGIFLGINWDIWRNNSVHFIVNLTLNGAVTNKLSCQNHEIILRPLGGALVNLKGNERKGYFFFDIFGNLMLRFKFLLVWPRDKCDVNETWRQY